MLNPTAWAWKAKAGFFWAGTSSLCLVRAFYRLPEPKGRRDGEMDMLFEQKMPARKFKHAVVDPSSVQDAAIELLSSSKKA